MNRPASETQRALVGVKLGGRYLVVRHVRDGALGAVYEATEGESTFAVKVIRRGLVSDDALSRFIRTASLMASAQAKRFVQVLDVGHDLEKDLLFIVMPFLRGEDLGTVLARTGPLAPPAAVRLALQAAEAVAEAHALDVVHRNVKPSNLFAEELEDGSLYVRLADQALATRAPVGEAGIRASSLSIRHLSPEQLSSSRTVDRRTDVHGLGVTLYELLAGVTPWNEPSVDRLISAISSGNPPKLQDRAPWIDPALATIVERAIRRDPERRFPSPEALATALRALLDGDPRLTRGMLVGADSLTRSRVAPRVVDSGADAFAPTVASESGGSDAEADELLGRRLGGRYTVRRLLGHGGMGAVYEVEDGNGARFAAKVILRDLAERQVAAIARFLREGRAVTRIQDAHVTRTLEIGTDLALGVPFLIMELLTGRDLASVLKERGAVATVPVLRVFLQAARGLAAAHAEGIIHRDIKPANIFLHVAEGEAARTPLTAKICDFGLAKAAEAVLGEQASHELTRSGGMLGTPLYMSPEHVTNAKNVDVRTDVWSLAASMFEALTGRKLWNYSSLGELMTAICSKPVPLLRTVAPGLDPAIAAVVDRGLAREPDARWPSVAAMIDALEPLVGGSEQVTLEELARIEPASLGIVEGALAEERILVAMPPGLPTVMSTLETAGGGVVSSRAASSPPPTTPSAQVEPPKPASRRWGRAAGLGTMVLALAVGGTLVGRRVRTAPPAVGQTPVPASPAAPPDFGSTMSTNAAAVDAYRAGIQAWRDASLEGAREKLEEATKLDPGFAAAHLRIVTLAVSPDAGVRAHAKSASEHRTALSVHDRDLLDAYLPWTGVPQDVEGTERKLGALTTASPNDADYAYHLCRVRHYFASDYASAAPACDAALRLDPQLVDAMRLKAFGQQAMGDEAGGIASFKACFQANHMAAACLDQLTELQIAAGKCDDAAATARKWIALDPAGFDAYRFLGHALYGAHQPDETVREVFSQFWQRLPVEDRVPAEAQVSAALDILSGDFGLASTRIATWEKAVAKSDDDWTHLLIALWKVTAYVETGHNAEAVKEIDRFFKRRPVWTPTSHDPSIFLRAMQLRLGAIDDAAWAASRETWLAAQTTALKAVQSRSWAWSYAYAYNVRNKADAVAALEALPGFLPITGGTLRSPDFDEALARVYLLAERPADALPFATRAAGTCSVLDYPIENTRALLHLGRAYEALGDRAGACDSYAAVLARWGRERRSVTADEAREGRQRLACADAGAR